jgi:hypothetical protein
VRTEFPPPVGVVRVLPPDIPGLPPAVRDREGDDRRRYDHADACMSRLFAVDAPALMEAFDDVTFGVYCTREFRHPEDEVHVCRLRDEGPPYADTHIIVWGGE